MAKTRSITKACATNIPLTALKKCTDQRLICLILEGPGHISAGDMRAFIPGLRRVPKDRKLTVYMYRNVPIEEGAFEMLMGSKEFGAAVDSLSMNYYGPPSYPDMSLKGLDRALQLEELCIYGDRTRHAKRQTHTQSMVEVGKLIAAEGNMMQNLCISECDLSTERIRDIFRGVDRGHCRLEKLMLENLEASEEGYSLLASALSHCPLLKSIRVRHMDVSYTSALEGVLTQLQHCPKMTNVEITTNMIADVHLHALAALLAKLPALTFITLRGSTFGQTMRSTTNEGVACLMLNGVAKSNSILRLKLDCHLGITDACAPFVLAGIRAHPSLYTVRLRYTAWPNKAYYSINDYLKSLHSDRARMMSAICSPFVVPRLGGGSSFQRLFPRDLLRRVREGLYYDDV